MSDEQQQPAGEQRDTSAADEKLLQQIRDDFRYHKEYWRENYEESEKDMNCAAAIPPADFSDDRKNRPCIWPDETSQYIKQFNNNLRQNKRGIKISPRGEQATDKDAEHRQAYVRGIEYASKAPSIYTTACESCAECAFGFWRVVLRVVSKDGHQEPRLARIPNWSTVYPDPDAKEADFSDQMRCFVIDTMRETVFARKYKNAKKRSFSSGERELASDWFSGESITVAEYWVREELGKEDEEKTYDVTQYITNGLEILEKKEWIGSWIPVIGVFGEEKYIRVAGTSKRMFMSLIRRARAPQQMLAYVASQEAEEFGMMPRAALQGYEGMFDPEKHKLLHKVPVAYVEFRIPDQSVWNPAWGAPPLPTRAQFTPNPQAYELSYERWRRAIQASMGSSPLPTAAQRLNEKSGKALEKIQTEQATGSFHITDNFMRALGNTGRQLDELITRLAELDSLPKQLVGKNKKDEDMILQVVPRSQPEGPSGDEQLPEANYFFAHRGKFEIAVSDGPNQLSEREEASDFADTLLQVLPTLGIPPALMQQILSIAIKLKNIGTYGDEIADLLSPPDENKLPPQAKAILAQAQGQIQMLEQEVKGLQLEKLAKVAESEGKLAVEKLKQETSVLVAEITTKAQNLNERMTLFMDMMQQWHQQAHEMNMAMQGHQNALEQGAQSAQQASSQSLQDAAQTAALTPPAESQPQQ